jgi:sulfite exporter TauE/SafE
MLVTLIIAFNLGLFSTVHCVGMCGGILTTMMFATPGAEQKNKLNIFNRSLAYNLGRISSYSIAGLLSGLIGLKIAGLSQNLNAHLILQSIAASVLIALALNILGLLPFKKMTEAIGMKLWKYIQPLGKHFYPVNSLSRAFSFGLVWGWLPCGLVYSALLLSLSAGSATGGMLTMLFFGLGTLPGMLTAGYFSDYLNRVKTNQYLRVITAILMILIAISLPLSTVYFSQHHDHGASDMSLHEHDQH